MGNISHVRYSVVFFNNNIKLKFHKPIDLKLLASKQKKLFKFTHAPIHVDKQAAVETYFYTVVPLLVVTLYRGHPL